MKRRTFLQSSLGLFLINQLQAGFDRNKRQLAEDVLMQATREGQIAASSLYVKQGDQVFARTFGQAKEPDAMFLLASLSKTISIAAVMTLFDEGLFRLDDPVQKYLPEFKREGREKITLRQLMTHISGLPDQLPQNAQLRSQHASLHEFVDGAVRTPLLFAPGTRYSYSSMAILLATEVARRISGKTIAELTQTGIYKPLRMTRSAMGLGRFKLSEVVLNQVEKAAPESGAGAENTKEWDWNSPYWRKLGAPWGAAHGSAEDMATFLNEFLTHSGQILKPATSRLMVENQNPNGMRPRGLGFDLGKIGGTPHLHADTFGHTGSTGTICWADPPTKSICVILTTLPARAVSPHPRDQASERVANAVVKS